MTADWPASLERPLVLGHRGTNLGVPENTLLAFGRALAQGADGVELDVRLSADAQPFVIHDADLKRVTHKRHSMRVDQLTARELGTVELAQGQGVPTLAEALIWAQTNDAVLNVELKSEAHGRSALVEAVARAIERVSLRLLLLSSFDLVVVQKLRERLPASQVAWLVDTDDGLEQAPDEALRLGLGAINPHHLLLTATSTARLKQCGLSINTWTVNSRARAIELASFGVDSIITDNPGEIAEALART